MSFIVIYRVVLRGAIMLHYRLMTEAVLTFSPYPAGASLQSHKSDAHQMFQWYNRQESFSTSIENSPPQ